MACTATLTTATVEPCDCGCDKRHPEDVTLHTLTCTRHIGHTTHHSDGSAFWPDDTPGATPHDPPLLSREDAVEALRRVRILEDRKSAEEWLEEFLPWVIEAAKKQEAKR